MKKVGRYLLTAVPLIVGLLIQVLCSIVGSIAYGFFYGVKSAMSGTTVSEAEVQAGFADCIIYILIISQVIALVAFGIWYWLQNRGKAKRSFIKVVHGRTVCWVVLWGIGLQLATNIALQLVYLIVPDAIEGMQQLMETAGIGEVNMFSMLATVILAPIVEEIIFRGVTFKLAGKAGAGFLVANMIQAVMFGVYHANLVQGIYAFVLGLVLGYVAYKYNSLYPAILLHLAYNLSATLLSAVAEYLPVTIVVDVLLLLIGIVFILLGALLLKKDIHMQDEMEV